jgi:hypothetical protein
MRLSVVTEHTFVQSLSDAPDGTLFRVASGRQEPTEVKQFARRAFIRQALEGDQGRHPRGHPDAPEEAPVGRKHRERGGQHRAATILDVIVFDKDAAEEEVPTVLFPAKEVET